MLTHTRPRSTCPLPTNMSSPGSVPCTPPCAASTPSWLRQCHHPQLQRQQQRQRPGAPGATWLAARLRLRLLAPPLRAAPAHTHRQGRPLRRRPPPSSPLPQQRSRCSSSSSRKGSSRGSSSCLPSSQLWRRRGRCHVVRARGGRRWRLAARTAGTALGSTPAGRRSRWAPFRWVDGLRGEWSTPGGG